jgi:hypothetical protein
MRVTGGIEFATKLASRLASLHPGKAAESASWRLWRRMYCPRLASCPTSSCTVKSFNHREHRCGFSAERMECRPARIPARSGHLK